VADVGLQRVAFAADPPRSGSRAYFVAKRVGDVVVASLLLVLVSPLLLVVAIAIKLDSPGPVIFAQQRIRGRRARADGEATWVIEPFTLYKFRTMQVAADASLHRDYITAYMRGDEVRLAELRPGRREGESFRPTADPRTTTVGRVLRTLSLDELPQLWNVVRGDMSLVGPRPPLDYEVEMYEEQHLTRLFGPPGITGWAQVKGRCSIDFEEAFRLDLEYLASRSLWLDVKIMLLTIPVVLSRKGAD
jgi:lipopolysaccharide/colanic/teichoic acid biosynthesis glycosyltransferase